MKEQFLEQKNKIIYSSVKYENFWPDNTNLGFPKHQVPLQKSLYKFFGFITKKVLYQNVYQIHQWGTGNRLQKSMKKSDINFQYL